MTPGYRFTLRSMTGPEQNIDYLIVRVTHKGQEGTSAPAYAGSDLHERLRRATVLHQFRPHHQNRRAGDAPTQTAFVVGPPGEEIYTDE